VSQLAEEVASRLKPQPGDPGPAVQAIARETVARIREERQRQAEFDALVERITEAVRDELEREDAAPLHSETVRVEDALPDDAPSDEKPDDEPAPK
jgi:hypothetical protein